MKDFANIVILFAIVLPILYLSYRLCDIQKDRQRTGKNPFMYMSPRRKLFCHYPVTYSVVLIVLLGMIWGYFNR